MNGEEKAHRQTSAAEVSRGFQTVEEARDEAHIGKIAASLGVAAFVVEGDGYRFTPPRLRDWQWSAFRLAAAREGDFRKAAQRLACKPRRY